MKSEMTAYALSIVHPAGTRIAEGKKTLEIRSWLPPRLPLLNLLVVENRRRLDREGEVDADGLGMAWIDILRVRPWTEEDASRDGHRFQPGYHAWEISNVRPVAEPFRVRAERGIYRVEVKTPPP
jgi:hypothetical protein